MFTEIDDIKKRRKARNMTQKQLSRMSGVSQSAIAKIESGRMDPSYSAVQDIFSALSSVENAEAIRARDIMNRKIIRVRATDSAHSAISAMRKADVSQIPVFEGENVVGSISERTIVDKMASGVDMKALQKMRVADMMEEAFPRIDQDTPIDVIVAILKARLAVLVSEKGRIVGIISKADLLKIV